MAVATCLLETSWPWVALLSLALDRPSIVGLFGYKYAVLLRSSLAADRDLPSAPVLVLSVGRHGVEQAPVSSRSMSCSESEGIG